MAKQSDLIQELSEAVKKLQVEFAEFKERIESSQVPTPAPTPTIPATPVEPPKDNLPKFPVPADFIDIVHTTLNKSFSVELESLTDSPAFVFTIIVPPKYSKVTSGQDLRPKVITNADGSGGVRQWAERVFASFDVSTQAMIVEDRPFAEAKI